MGPSYAAFCPHRPYIADRRKYIRKQKMALGDCNDPWVVEIKATAVGRNRSDKNPPPPPRKRNRSRNMVSRVETTETTEVIHKCSNAISEETTQHARRRSCELTTPPSELTIHPCQSEEFLLDITCRKQRLENNIVNLRIPMTIYSIWCGQDNHVARSPNTTHSNVQVAMCGGIQRQV